MYNLTNVTAANTPIEIVGALNDLSGGLYVSLMMIVLFLIFLVVFKKNSMKKVLIADSFFMVLIGSFAFTMGWVGEGFIIVPVVLFFGFTVAYLFTGD